MLNNFTGDEKLAASVTLPLAERMIGVMEKDKKIKQEQETRLFLMVLELQVSNNNEMSLGEVLINSLM